MIDHSFLQQLYKAPPNSHKGQNGKLMVIGGSHLFHAASLWSLKVASRIVDMVFYSSVADNNELVLKAKEEFRDGIVVPRAHVDNYIEEADCILIGPGMVRAEGNQDFQYQLHSLAELDHIKSEGAQTFFLTKYLLHKYPHKKWVIDAGALQMMRADWLNLLHGQVTITPHLGEFEKIFKNVILSETKDLDSSPKAQNDIVSKMAKEYNCTILLKGEFDIISNGVKTVRVPGGNPGMTKGGTGDVLAGLVGALSCKNDMYIAAIAASFINKKAGESLHERVGNNFNSSDLCDEIPHTMRKLLIV